MTSDNDAKTPKDRVDYKAIGQIAIKRFPKVLKALGDEIEPRQGSGNEDLSGGH
ncbi:hypothetical protein EVB27_063 [Rhizobium phage RHph_TM16]|nr:hypothetical protein EVB27_063 [Rhizobium phage RHph_TM16]